MAAHLDPHAQPLSDASDMELVEYTRGGNSAAFGELWVRHSNAGRAVARSHRFDADDLLSEAFARVFQAISAGGGPTAAFRPYLFTTIRNVSMQWARAKSADASEDLDLLADPSTEEDASLAALDKSLTVNAFRSLPTRWQEALWYSEVEQLSSAEIAPLLGMKANAVSALTYRAREGLRQAWIQAHLQRTTDPECAAAIERLGSFTRGVLGTRESKRVRDHLAGCTSCTIVADEARQVGSRLALVLLPLAAGVSGAAGFLSWLQAGSGAAGGMAAAAAMPAHLSTSAAQVVAQTHLGGSSASSLAGTSNAGASTASASTTSASNTSNAAGGTAASSSGGATGAAATGVSAAGFGAAGIVGTAVGALALAAAVVAAVTLGPGLFSPRADEATTSAEVSPDDSALDADDTNDAAVVAEPTPTPASTQAPTEAPTPTPEPTRPSAPSNPTMPAVAPEPAVTEPSVPSAPAEQPTTPPTVEPTVPPTAEPTVPPTEPTDPPIDPETPTVPNSQYAPTDGNRTYPTFSGSDAEPASTIDLVDDDGFSVAQTTADGNGNWSIGAAEFGTSLTAGTRTLRVTQTVDGTASDPALPQSVTLAAPTIVSPSVDQEFEDGQWTLTLTGDDGANVDVEIDHNDDGVIENTLHLSLVDGVFSTTYGNLAEIYRLNIRYVDGAGNFGVTQTVRFTVQG